MSATVEHVAAVARLGELTIRATCSCGSWLIATGDRDGRLVVSWRFNRLCHATDLAYARLKNGKAS